MRAAVLWAVGEALDVRDDVELTEPGPGEVRVRIGASGVCHSDLSIQNGTFPSPLFPAILGHEGAGEVVEVGEGVAGLAVGAHVVLSWVPQCGTCRYCLAGQPNLCAGPAAVGLPPARHLVAGQPAFAVPSTATFAEETVVSVNACVPIPDDVPLDIAALLGCGVMTGVGAALNTARVQPGSSVVVIGCGGVGINVIQGARIAGAAEIVAVDKVEAKREWARSFGATHSADPSEVARLSSAITDGEGFDYAFEVIGLPETIRAAWDATRRGGTTVVVGAGPVDAQVAFSPFELFYMERKLLGCLYGSADVRRDFPRLLRLWRQGRLDLEGLISRRVQLPGINDAFSAMERGEVIRTVVEL